MEQGVSYTRALELISAQIYPVGTERVPLRAARGRVLAEDIAAPIDQPPFPRSPLDGYALHAFDTVGADKSTPARLTVTGTVCAGGWFEGPVGPGEAVRIMTGAPIPKGADCVVRQEDTDLGERTVAVCQTLRPFDNYCFAGEDFQRGQTILPAGTVLSAAALGVLSSAGLAQPDARFCVRRIPRIALLCTGDELVPNGVSPLPKGKIYSSNHILLTARMEELGLTVVDAGHPLSDDAESVADVLRRALADADAVITTGGVSVGIRDIFHEVYPLLGTQPLFWRVLLKPGSPLMFAVCGGKPMLSLSGNPFAAAATFEIVARPMLAALAGNPALAPLRAEAVLGSDFPKGSGVTRYARGTLRDGTVLLPERHASGQLCSAVGTNCLVEFPAGSGGFHAGQRVTIYLL